MKIQAAHEDYKKKVLEAKELVNRMNKGKRLIEELVTKNEVNQAVQGIRLYTQLMNELFVIMEECTLLHEHLAMDKHIVLKRDGSAYDVKELFKGIGEEKEISPWELQSMKILEGVFGDQLRDVVEFRDTEE